MSAYILVLAEITNPDRFAAYTQVVPPLIEKFGGSYQVLGGDMRPLEGEWGDTKVVISHWPNKAAAESFWFSDEYAEAKKLRAGTGDFRVTLVEGVHSAPLES